jgi:hypothetical protein
MFALGGAMTYLALSFTSTQTAPEPKLEDVGAGTSVTHSSLHTNNDIEVVVANVQGLEQHTGSQSNDAEQLVKLVNHNQALKQKLAKLEQKNAQLSEQLLLEEQNNLDLQTELGNVNKRAELVRTELQSRVTELHSQNNTLTSRLEASVPKEQRDTYESLETIVPEAFKHSIARLPEKRKQEIVDFHEQQEVSDWGYNMQQALTDFVTGHTLAEYVTLDSVICKLDACEMSLSETINKQVLAEQGLSREEIQHISQSETPKYRQILDDIKASSVLNLRSNGGMHGRFNSYAFFKSKQSRS